MITENCCIKIESLIDETLFMPLLISADNHANQKAISCRVKKLIKANVTVCQGVLPKNLSKTSLLIRIFRALGIPTGSRKHFTAHHRLIGEPVYNKISHCCDARNTIIVLVGGDKLASGSFKERHQIASLIKQLQENCGLRFIVIGGPNLAESVRDLYELDYGRNNYCQI